jgi:MFS transporter, PPP family, 3-phenylpropionic acid transporter
MVRFAVHYFLLFTVMATVFPYFQLLLDSLGYSKFEVGLLQGVMGLAGVFGPLLTGALADAHGARRYTLGACLAVFILFLPLLLGVGALLPAAAVVALLGMSVRSTIPLTDALITGELSDPVHQYGRVRVWGSVGFAVVLSLIRVLDLADETSSRSMAICMIVAAGLCMVSSLTLPEHHARRRRSEGESPGPMKLPPVFWLFLMAAGLHQFGMSAYYSFFTLYLREEVGMQSGAWVWGIGAAAEIPVLFFGGRIIRRTGLAAMLMASAAAVSVRLGLYAVSASLWVILPSQLLHAMAFGLFHAACIELIRRNVPAHARGRGMALYMSVAVALPYLVGSTLGGMIVGRWGYPALFGIYSVVPLIGIAISFAARRALDSPGTLDATT